MVQDIPARVLIDRLTEELKRLEQLNPPGWSHFAKTGVHKEHPPEQPDWWYRRAASVLRRVYLTGPVGVSRLRTHYGGRKSRGVAPEHSRKGSGKVQRTVLQQLERAGLIRQVEGRGRKVTQKGVEIIDRLAEEIRGAKEVG